MMDVLPIAVTPLSGKKAPPAVPFFVQKEAIFAAVVQVGHRTAGKGTLATSRRHLATPQEIVEQMLVTQKDVMISSTTTISIAATAAIGDVSDKLEQGKKLHIGK